MEPEGKGKGRGKGFPGTRLATCSGNFTHVHQDLSDLAAVDRARGGELEVAAVVPDRLAPAIAQAQALAAQAVRFGDWKGILNRKKRGSWDEILAAGDTPWALYDLSKDVSETTDVAADHPELLARMAKIAAREFTPARPGTYRDPNRTRHERDRWALSCTAVP